MSTRPLADEIRPQSLDEVVGQRHLIGPGGVLRRLIDAGTSANMIFYGPSGTGKTTIANIIANKTNKTLYRLNATTASLQDVKDIIASVGTLMAPGGILLYLDEFQQEAAAEPVGVHGERLHHAHRVHDGESVFLCLQRAALALDGV